MIVLEQNTYDPDGLNGLKIGKFIKKNLKSAQKDISIKNAIKVVKTAAPIALSLIPIGGGAASSAAGKLLAKASNSGIGKFVTKVADSKVVQGVQKLAKTEVGKLVVAKATPLVKNATANLLAKAGGLPNDEQIATLAAAKGTTPQEELDAIVAAAPNLTSAAAGPATPAKSNTMLYVGGGLAAATIAYLVFKK